MKLRTDEAAGRAVRAGKLELDDELGRTDRIEQRGEVWVVLAEGPDGEVLGEHPTEAEALEQLRAIEAAKERRQGARGDSVQRWDRLELRLDASTVVTHENGWIDVTGTATRSGVFLYLQGDGSTRRELRPPAEVFDGASLATLRGVPFTNDHPVEPLDAKNTRLHQVGTVLEVLPRPDAGLVDVRLRITDQATIDEIGSGKVELSGGYTTDVVDESGTFGSERFDAVQTKIRYNHLALVDEARAGPVARLRLDGAQQMPKTTKIKIGDRTHELKLDQIETVPITIGDVELVLPMSMVAKIEALVTGEPPPPPENMNAEPEAEVLEAAADIGGLVEPGEEQPEETIAMNAEDPCGDKNDRTGRSDDKYHPDHAKRLDALERAVRGMPEQVRRQARARGALERQAGPILGVGFKFDAASDTELMAATILAVDPELKVRVDANKADAGYLRGMFELAVEQHAKRLDSTIALGTALTGARKDGADDRIDSARKRYLARLANPKASEAATN